MKAFFKRIWAKDIARYWVVANICAIGDLGLFWLLTAQMDVQYMVAATMSWALGMALNYTLCILWIFESGARFENKRTEISAVYLVSIVGLLIHHSALWVYLNQFGISLIYAKIFAMFTMFFWNYWGRKHIVFKELPERSALD